MSELVKEDDHGKNKEGEEDSEENSHEKNVRESKKGRKAPPHPQPLSFQGEGRNKETNERDVILVLICELFFEVIE